jgi:hypothetical protein
MVSDHRQSQKTERGGGRSLAAQDVGFICHNATGRKKAIFCHRVITTEKKNAFYVTIPDTKGIAGRYIFEHSFVTFFIKHFRKGRGLYIKILYLKHCIIYRMEIHQSENEIQGSIPKCKAFRHSILLNKEVIFTICE